jgi:hypothetical protein
MATTLTISDLVARASEFTEEARTPFAEAPWVPTSKVLWNEGDNTDPIIQDGKVFGYFLEPSVILEITESMSDEQPVALVERIIQYAENDA